MKKLNEKFKQHLLTGDEVLPAEDITAQTGDTATAGLPGFKNPGVGAGIAAGGALGAGLVDAIEGDHKTIGGQALGGALKGAAAGAALGPVGAIAGAALGGLTSALTQNAAKKKEEKAKAEKALALKNANAMVAAGTQMADNIKEEQMMKNGGEVKGKNYVYPAGKDIPLSDKEGYTESQLAAKRELEKGPKKLGKKSIAFTVKGNGDIAISKDGYVNGGVVKGKSGIDKVEAKLPTGAFVVPAENANHPVVKKASEMLKYGTADKTKGDNDVMLTKGEVVIEKKHKPIVDKLAKVYGMKGIHDLAPNAVPGNKKFLGGDEPVKTPDEIANEALLADDAKRKNPNAPVESNPAAAKSTLSKESPFAKEITKNNYGPDPVKPAVDGDPVKAEPKKKSKVDVGTGLGLAQSVIGMSGVLASGDDPGADMPEYTISPLIQNDVAALAAKRDKGLDAAVRSSMEKSIENERQTNLAIAKETSGGSNVTSFNRAILANSNATDKKLAISTLDQEQRDKNLAASMEGNKVIAGMERTIYEDKVKKKLRDQEAWEKKQLAWGTVLSSGIQNVIGANQLKKENENLAAMRKIIGG